MQRQAQQQPFRPMPLQGGGDLQQLLELARSGALNRSAFTSVAGAPGFLPEFSIYSTAQLSGLLGGNSNLQLDQLAQLQQLQNLQNQAALALGSNQTAQPESSGVSRNSQGRATSRGDKSTSAYASRHQAAEARRRTRINDRLERLRQIVPHSERANTATFLEEVFTYVEMLQARVTQLETGQGLPLTCAQQTKVSALPAQAWLAPAVQPTIRGPAIVAPAAVKPAASSAPQQPVGRATQSSADAPVPFIQRDRPETPPQQLSVEELDEVTATEREASPATSSEGSAAKKQKSA